MKKATALQVCVVVLVCLKKAVIGSPVECPDQEIGGTSCTISAEKLLDRAVQHAELIYRFSEEAKLLFDELLDLFGGMNQYIPGGAVCAPKTVPVPLSKSEIQQISDRWLLHSVLILVQFWIEPLVNLQKSLENYKSAPIGLLSRNQWIASKLSSLEEGLLVLIRQILGEGGLVLGPPEDVSDNTLSVDAFETVRRDYSVIYCFRKDAHKIQTFLKLLKCRQVDRENCSLF
ncbi:somatolactin beta precursor [Danio rerio]|uniref:Somatolactin beta n=1 Tax=Danio rerio TaxID=7955 RepID=Q330P5_DANRE|nr:somatolactin beta precursor [Danio rerio]XP_056323073.1 somatolactin beta [Danio aesculapii]AAP50851.1 somatolactin beta precursor [Danio rerio]|eukprot:NP_001032763.1 somatolactin beta precursor [Danio rerio]